jgi:excisionase family DNA binding protein
MDMNNNLLNIEEFAAAVGWKPATVRQKVWRRQIDFIRMGRSIRFKPETVQKLIERGTVPALERQ